MGKGRLSGAVTAKVLAKVLASVVACAALLSLAFASVPARAQTAFDRPGGDYFSSPVASGDPEDCALLCERDRRCRSWSFSYPDVEGGSAVCWLKNTVPARVPGSCCISGVRGAGVIEPRVEGVETSIDIECPECWATQEIELPFDRSFFQPSKAKARSQVSAGSSPA